MFFFLSLEIIIMKNKILVKTPNKRSFVGLIFIWVKKIYFFLKRKATSHDLEAGKNLWHVFKKNDYLLCTTYCARAFSQ